MNTISAQDWDIWLNKYPEAHLLQTVEWGKLKSPFGWKPCYIAGGHCGAMILFKTLPLGLKIGYIPKGPIGTDWGILWPQLEKVCKQERAIFVKIEPDLWETQPGDNINSLIQFASNSSDTIQPRRTIVVSLNGDEEEWLQQMKQKTRYNIRLAKKKGVIVKRSQDISKFSDLMNITGKRDGFGVHTANYYARAYELFASSQQCDLLMATYEDQVLAGLMVFRRGSRAWFMFGGTSNQERNRMPAYLIQWEAMRWAAEKNCLEYDLWGAPDYEEAVLEDEFQGRGEGLWGVYRFKRGFGGQLRRSIGAWDKIFYRNIYWAYQWYLKRKQLITQ